MSSALKSDVESATEMARLARRSSEIREGSLTESIGGGGGGGTGGPGTTSIGGSLIRRRSRRKSRRGTIQRKVGNSNKYL